VLLASSSIPGFFSPVSVEVEANGKHFQEMHSDGTLTAPFFVVPESMLSANAATRPPVSELYVIVNSKLGPEFKMPDRDVPGVLGRSIAVALTAALQAQIALTNVGALRHGIALRIAQVNPEFNHPSRGPFDGEYMQTPCATLRCAGPTRSRMLARSRVRLERFRIMDVQPKAFRARIYACAPWSSFSLLQG
jgi:predicted acylesterase/phospholipase RssA